ncbi:MAG: DUF3990 domain-containing protein [Paramuribaculum sp.]|nr:DUF3990 domain-containing protein [Paramuribaculum sp.]
MKLYHSSNIVIKSPLTNRSRDFLDFGKGFYLTTLKDQAVRYGERFVRRGKDAWLNTFILQYEPNDWKVKIFNSYDEDWLLFVSKCRAGLDDTDYDMVIGGIANDKVILTLDRYFNGEISVETALGLLKFEKPNNQICIRSQRMIDLCLTHIESLKI